MTGKAPKKGNMSMNKKTILSIVAWLLALLCCLFLLDQAMRRDDGKRKYGPFFAEKNNFDVLFMGSSHVLDGVQPMELWRDYGYATYNMGFSSESMEMTEWVLRLALEYNKPKMVIIDTYYVNRSIDDAWAFKFRHAFLDEIPLSRSKFEAVRATMPKSEWLEFLMPFSLYHGRWEEMLTGKVERIVDCEPYMMGSELRPGSCRDRQEDMDVIAQYRRTTEMNMENMPGKDALRRIVALCRENGVEPVFMAIPGPVSEEEQMNMNSIHLIAQELDVPYIDMFEESGLLVWADDCYDYLGHLNPVGSSKVTAYLGRWLNENAQLTDKRGRKEYEHWDENLVLYEAHRERVMTDY